MTSGHNYAPDIFGPEYGKRALHEGTIAGLTDLAEHVGAYVREGDTCQATLARIRARIYKDTECGCSVHFVPFSDGGGCMGVSIHGYCEGVDRDWPGHYFAWGGSARELDECIADADKDGCDAWNNTHGCADCGPVDPETGYRRVDPECKACGGTGTIL